MVPDCLAGPSYYYEGRANGPVDPKMNRYWGNFCAIRGIPLLWAMLSALSTSALPAQSPPASATAIASMPMAQALQVYAQQTGLQVVYVSEVVQGVLSKGVPAGLAPRETLKRLLEGTGVTFEFLNDRTVRIFKAGLTQDPTRNAAITGNSASADKKSQETGNVNDRWDEQDKHTGIVARLLGMFAICTAAALQSNPACAQAAADVQGTTTQPAAPAQQAARSDASNLQEIVVTAERRSENVQTIPIAITALEGSALEDKAVASLADLQTASPSVSIGSTGVTDSVNIRGIGIASGLANVSNGVATYVDGLFQPQIVTNNQFYDLADIEVLRGPQGTLVGSNSTGGAIFVNSQNPKLGQVGGYVTIGGGDYGDADAQAAFNLPIGDVLAVRVAGDSVSRSSFYSSTGPAYTTAGERREQSGRLSILLKPGNFQALAKVEYTDRNSGGYAATAIPGTPYAAFAPTDPFRLDYDTPTLEHETSLILPIELRYELPDGITLRSISGYQDKHVHDLEDYDFTTQNTPPNPQLTWNNQIREREWTEEVNILSPKHDLYDWILGYYYQRNKIDVAIDETGATGPGGPPLFITTPTNKKTTGVFGQMNLRFSHQWEFGLGLRYSTFSTDGNGFVALNIPPGLCGLPIPGVPPVKAPYNGCLITGLGGSESDGRGTGKVSLNYTPDDNNLIYAFVAKGYKAGGFSSQTSNFAPETVVDLELGWKASFADQHIRTQIDGFHYSYKDFQFQNIQLSNGSQNVSNLPTATIYGFEATVQAKFGAFSADGGLAYVHSWLPGAGVIVNTHLMPPGTVGVVGPQCGAGQTVGCFDYTPFEVNDSGGPNLYSPEWTYNIGAQYRFLLADQFSVTPRLNFSYVGSQFVGLTYSRTQDELPARGLLSALVTFKIGAHWNAELYGTNLTDKVYPVGQIDTNYFIYGAPRQYGGRIGYEF
jgi:iron complex outermembrane recepter protein